MQPTPAPWRVLETPGPGSAPQGSGEADPEAAPGRPPWIAVVAIAVAGVLLLAAFALASQPARDPVEVRTVSADGSSGPPGSSSGAKVVVEVAGAVLRPGVYTLAANARVGDAIAAAGGYGPRVDAEAAERDLNLATKLVDGARIRVPARGDGGTGAPTTGPGTTGNPGAGRLLDLNRATAAELESLPGIGSATAGKIQSSRAERTFASVDELVQRKLVSAKVLEAIRGLVTVG